MNGESTPVEQTVSSVDVKTQHIIISIASRKWILLIISIAVFAFSFYLIKYKWVTYSATVGFVVSEPPVPSTANQEEYKSGIFSRTEGFDRMMQMILSYDMVDHLINKFDLYKQYGFDTTKEFSYERMSRFLLNHMQIMKNPYNVILVTYTDVHRYRAAEITNEIAYYLDTLNKKMIIRSIRQRAEISKAILRDLGMENARQAGTMDSLLKKLDVVLAEMSHLKTGSSLADLER